MHQGEIMLQPYYFYSDSQIGVLEPDELDAAREVFGTHMGTMVSQIPAGSLVVPRFRAIPFGPELDKEVQLLGSHLVNSYSQHRNIADLFTWVHLLDGLTAKAYSIEDIPKLPEGEYFVKGETNSIKNKWFDSAYAETKHDLLRVVNNVLSDTYVGSQRIVIRPFQHFRLLGKAVDSRPIFHERRVFVLDGEILSEGFYWSNHVEYSGVQPLDFTKYMTALMDAIDRTKHLARFYVIDMAEYPDGSWAVVELNDGCMSGLSDNDPKTLWANFAKTVQNNQHMENMQ